MHQAYPETLTTPVLAQHFAVSPEAIRRILKSKWKPNEEEETARMERWERRGKEVWERLVKEKGFKPPQKWRDLGVKGPKRMDASGALTRLENEYDIAEKSRARENSKDGAMSTRKMHDPQQFQQRPERGPRLSDDAWWEKNVLSSIKPVTQHSRAAVPEL